MMTNPGPPRPNPATSAQTRNNLFVQNLGSLSATSVQSIRPNTAPRTTEETIGWRTIQARRDAAVPHLMSRVSADAVAP